MRLTQEQLNLWLKDLQDNTNQLFTDQDTIDKRDLRDEINYNLTQLRRTR